MTVTVTMTVTVPLVDISNDNIEVDSHLTSRSGECQTLVETSRCLIKGM